MRKRITWLEQVDTAGCGIACLAMLMGTTYARVREAFPRFCNNCGIDPPHMDHFLAVNGYAVQRIYPERYHDGKQNAPWPPKPFAERHLVLVRQTLKDISADSHYVVMDWQGRVYDPADPHYTPSKLSRYFAVDWVAGVAKVTR